MSSGKAWRLGGFVAALAASAGLVATASGATGAYFTESKPGALNVSTGGVHLSTSDLQLNFNGLLPGDLQDKTVTYTSTGSAPEDIWLVLPTDGSADALFGTAGEASGAAALGRYGHFAISSPAGSFTSYNLATAGTGTHSGPTCTVDALGHGGSSQQAANRTDYTTPFCPVPTAILLSGGLAPGATASATITFGFTKLMNNPAQEDQPLSTLAKFNVVATQHGVTPNDPNN
jgi:hypothetical protein